MNRKKMFFILSFIAALALARHALAADGFTALAPIPGLTDQTTTSVVDSTTLANFFNNLYKYLVGLAAILAVIEIIWGGLEYSTQDSVSKQSDGKERIYGAITGLILVLSPVLVFSIINPSILNLSLNLPEIKSVAIQQFAPKPKSGCDDSGLTPEQQSACRSAQKVSGTNPSAPASSEDIRAFLGGAEQLNNATLANQVSACSNGGFVSGDSLYRDKSSGRCSSAGDAYAKKHGYTTCTVLVNNTSVCFK
jgi:hypothetical protein